MLSYEINDAWDIEISEDGIIMAIQSNISALMKCSLTTRELLGVFALIVALTHYY